VSSCNIASGSGHCHLISLNFWEISDNISEMVQNRHSYNGWLIGNFRSYDVRTLWAVTKINLEVQKCRKVPLQE